MKKRCLGSGLGIYREVGNWTDFLLSEIMVELLIGHDLHGMEANRHERPRLIGMCQGVSSRDECMVSDVYIPGSSIGNSHQMQGLFKCAREHTITFPLGK